jgi:hypothetical protein
MEPQDLVLSLLRFTDEPMLKLIIYSFCWPAPPLFFFL